MQAVRTRATATTTAVQPATQSKRRPFESSSRQVVEPRLRHDFANLAVNPVHIQRRATSAQNAPAIAPRSVDRALADPGSALEPPLRSDMEWRFGVDFSKVRVHTDGTAAASASDVDAHAYTVGQDVVFSAGQFRPSTIDGRRLIAHELTHVVQQGNGVARRLQRQPAGCAALRATPQIAGGVSGTTVHQLILAHFMASVAGARPVLIPGASAAPLRTQGLCGDDDAMIKPQIGRSGPGVGRGGASLGVGIPDLSRSTRDGVLEVAEIKPASPECLVDGMEQLEIYVAQGNAPDAAQQRWRDLQVIRGVIPMLMSSYTPAPVLWVGACPVLVAWCGPGLMGYKIVCPVGAPPLPQEQEQTQEQEAPARDSKPTFRLPSGDVWDWVYGIIAAIGAIAIVASLWGKIGALLGTLARALGFTLGLLAGGASAAADGSGTPTPTPGKTSGTPVPGSPAPPARSTTTTPRRRTTSSTAPTQKTTEPGRKVQIDLIEGVNLDSLSVGMIFPLMLSDMKTRHDISILQVTGITKGRHQTTVELKALQERVEGATGEPRPQVLMGNAYTVTHPFVGSDPKLVGTLVKTGSDPQWVWTYLENLATKLEAAGKKAEASGVRQEIQRQKDLFRKVKSH